MKVLLIYKWMEHLSCLPLPFETLSFIFKLFSQHLIGTRTDSVVLIMVRNEGFSPLVTAGEWQKNVIFHQFLFFGLVFG